MGRLAVAALVCAVVMPAGGYVRAEGGPEGVAATEQVEGLFKRPHVAGELVVKFRDGAGKRAVDDLVQAGLEIAEAHPTQPSLLRVRAVDDRSAAASLRSLREDSRVEYAEPNYLFQAQTTPNDPRFKDQWGLSNTTNGVDIGAVQAWDKTTGSDDVVVGIIDSGVDVRHKDLKDNIFVNAGEIANNGVDDDRNGYVDDVNGWDGITNSGRIVDPNGHGTHVAGIVGARGNNGEGVVGVAWRVKLLPLRFLAETGSGSSFNAIKCIDYAIKLRQSGVNVRVLNNSWGGGPFATSILEAIRRANAAGIVFVVAAGNDRNDTDAVASYPSNYDVPNLISVGAMTKGNAMASFSNFGRRNVDVFAPGEAIVSTLPNNTYGAQNGTSMASPMVAGIAALVAAAHPDASVAEIKARILGSVITDSVYRTICLTGGRVSASNALRTESTPPAPLVDFRLRSVTRSTLALEWTAVGDDGASGQAVYYDIRYSTSPITAETFDGATQIGDTRMPLRVGETETALVRGCFEAGSAVYVAMRAYDKAGNFSQSSTLIAEPTGELTSYRLLPAGDVDTSLGTPLDLRKDDAATAVELPFVFPFFGGGYETAYVSTNGLITFDAPNATPVGNRTDLAAVNGIAPMWIDLRTDGKIAANEDIYVETTPSSATFRWIAELYYEPNAIPKDAQPISFAVTLHADGGIDIVYGPGGNKSLRSGNAVPVIGLSDGGCSVTILDAFSGQQSLANAPAISLEPTEAPQTNAPAISNTGIPLGLLEGTPFQFTVQATDPGGLPVEIAAALPRNATFDEATGVVTFSPDSTQGGDVFFVFTATNSAGASRTRTIVATIGDNANLPEVKYVQAKKKVVFNGVGFRVGSRVEIDGGDVGDARNAKSAPATKMASSNARSMLDSAGVHTIVVVNPDGTRSGPFHLWR